MQKAPYQNMALDSTSRLLQSYWTPNTYRLHCTFLGRFFDTPLKYGRDLNPIFLHHLVEKHILICIYHILPQILKQLSRDGLDQNTTHDSTQTYRDTHILTSNMYDFWKNLDQKLTWSWILQPKEKSKNGRTLTHPYSYHYENMAWSCCCYLSFTLLKNYAPKNSFHSI